MQIRDPRAAALVNSALMAYANSLPPGLQLAGQSVRPQEPLELPTGAGTARQVIARAPRLTARERIDQGFEDAGIMPPTPPLPASPSGGPQMIGPESPGAPPLPTAPPVPGSRHGPGPLSNMLGLPPEWSNRIADAMAGLAGGDPTAPPLQAMASGFVGARSSRDAREQRKREEMMRDEQKRIEAEERARKRRMEDARFAMEQEEHGWARSERPLKEIKALVEIERTLTDTKKARREAEREGLTVDQVLEINRLAIDAYEKALPDIPLEEDYEAAAVAAAMFKEQATREAQQAAGMPGERGERQTVKERGTPAKVQGEGTYESPYRPSTMEDAMALPSGSYFVDEAGQVRVKR